jgi:hypothetical protein
MVQFSVRSKVLGEVIPGLGQIGAGHKSFMSFFRGHCWRQPVLRVGAVLAESVPGDCDEGVQLMKLAGQIGWRNVFHAASGWP